MDDADLPRVGCRDASPLRTHSFNSKFRIQNSKLTLLPIHPHTLLPIHPHNPLSPLLLHPLDPRHQSLIGHARTEAIYQ
jgi:hypothetical protein